MPGFDGTGPRGMGPMTGGGRGFCSPWGVGAALRAGAVPPYPRAPYPFYGSPAAMPYYGSPGAMPYGGAAATPGATPFAPQASPAQELDFLKSQAQGMREQLEGIESRIREMESKR